MSSLLLTLARENPWPGIAVASLNLIVALSLVGCHDFGARLGACARRSRAGAACGQAGGLRMTSALLLARDGIICWVAVWLAPVECAFDMIESELVRRGVELDEAEHPSLHAV